MNFKESARQYRHWLWAGAVFILAVLLASYLSHRSKADATGSGRSFDPNRAMPVVVEAAKKGDVDIYIDALGTITASYMVTVHPRVDGQLDKVHFKEGDTVKEGALLAEIDPRPFQVLVAQAEGQQARDQAQLKNAEVDLERYQTLLAQDSISKQQVDTQEALVRQYKGALLADKAAVDSARLQLTYSRVTAPISGRLGLRQVDPGNIVHASDVNGLVVITDVEPITAVFSVPEDKLVQIIKPVRDGQTLVVDAYDKQQKTKLATGRLMTLDNQIDTATGTIKLKAEFDNHDHTLYPNQFVNIRLHVATLRDATQISTAAVQNGTPGTFVFVVKPDQTAGMRVVKLGPIDGLRVAITEGLQPGEQVIVDGGDKIRDGDKVEVIDPNSRPKAAGDQPAQKQHKRRRPAA